MTAVQPPILLCLALAVFVAPRSAAASGLPTTALLAGGETGTDATDSDTTGTDTTDSDTDTGTDTTGTDTGTDTTGTESGSSETEPNYDLPYDTSCGCASTRDEAPLAIALGLLVLGALAPRRRRSPVA